MKMTKDGEGKIDDIGDILGRDLEIVCTETPGISATTIAMRETERGREKERETETEEEMYVVTIVA